MNRVPADLNGPGAAFPPVRPDDGHCDGHQAARLRDGKTVDWENLRRRLAPVRGKWDLAVLANLASGVARPGDLIEAINAQTEDRRISWKVLTETLRRLEDEGYVGHKEISRLPRVTRYWLMPPGYRLVSALCMLDVWYWKIETGAGCPDQPDTKEPAGQADGNTDVQLRTAE